MPSLFSLSLTSSVSSFMSSSVWLPFVFVAQLPGLRRDWGGPQRPDGGMNEAFSMLLR